MTSETRAALRKRLAREMAIAEGYGADAADEYMSAADAAIDMMLEEAARVTEETVAYSTGQAVIRESIAAAIRGMKGS
jgi:hypothetical protein